MVVNSARVVGPALAGVLILTVGTTVCFGLNALSYLTVIAALIAIRPRKAGGPAPPGRRGVKEGLRYAASRQQLWLPLLMMLLVGLLAFNFAVILPVLAKDTFRGTGGTYGLLTTMLSIGAVVGSLAVGLIHHPRRQYLLFAALGFAVTLAATAAAPNVAVACVTLLVTGATAFCFVTLCSTTLQLHSSSAYRGRIMALWVFVYLGTTPIGSIVTGWIISAGGPRVALLVGSGACLAAAVLAAFVHTPPIPTRHSRTWCRRHTISVKFSWALWARGRCGLLESGTETGSTLEETEPEMSDNAEQVSPHAREEQGNDASANQSTMTQPDELR